MADEIKEVTTKSYGNRLMSSISGIVTGLILFMCSFGVLYWNEGRVNQAKIASNAVSISADQRNTDTNLNGRLVAVTGALKSAETIGDGQYVQTGPYLSINRTVEMYAWIEETKSQSKTDLGGKETTETTYTYKKDWVSAVPQSSSFKETTGHENPSKTLDNYAATVKNGTIGVYRVNIADMQLTGSQDLTLETNKVTNLPPTAKVVPGGKYIFIPAAEVKPTTTTTTTPTAANPFAAPAGTTPTPGTTTTPTASTLEQPKVGDMRVSYSVVPSGLDVTVMGKLNGDAIGAHFDAKNNKLYRAFEGTADNAVATLQREYTTSLWIWRIIGFLMMWMGLVSILNPISVLLDVIPFLGKVSGSMISLAAFLVSAVLSFVTIIISMILHSLVLLIILLVAVVGGGYYWYTTKKKGKGTAPATPTTPTPPPVTPTPAA